MNANSYLKCIGFQSIEFDDSTPVGIDLDLPDNIQVHYAMVALDAALGEPSPAKAAYYRIDGKENPSVGNAMPMADGQYTEISTLHDIARFKIIGNTPSLVHKLQVQLFGTDDI